MQIYKTKKVIQPFRLHYFSKFGNICHFRAVSCLINNGADVNAQCADDNLTPLMLACKCQKHW